MSYVIYHPGTPGTPATPGRYVTTPLAWDSGAVSIPLISTDDGGYEFKVPVGTVGAVVGITSAYSGSGYLTIPHALYFSHGVVQVMEYGSAIATLEPYLSTDVFVILRIGSRVHFFRNGVKEFDRPNLVFGTFYLAATMFSPGDTVVDAKVATVAFAAGDCSGVIGPIKGISFEVAGNYGNGELGALESTSSARGNGSVGSSFLSLVSLSGDKAFAAGNGLMAPISSYSEGGLLAPSWGACDSGFSPLSSLGIGLTGEIGGGGATLRPIKARGSDHNYAEGVSELMAVDAFGAEMIFINAGNMQHGGRYVITSTVTAGDAAQAMPLPALTMVAYSGATARISAPRLAFDGTMTIPAIVRATMKLPRLRLASAGTVSGVAFATLTITNRYVVATRPGAQARLTGPSLTMQGVGETGGVVRAELKFEGRYSLVAAISASALAKAALVGPPLRMAPVGHAWLVAPALTVRAEGGGLTSVTYESYAINLTTGAVTHYTDYPFDNVIRFGDRFFGVKKDGMYELVGDTDNGEPINAEITTFMTDFNVENLKRVQWLYLFGRLGEGMDVTVTPDEGVSYTYQTVGASYGTMRMHRAKPGRGIKGTYYSFTLKNVSGSMFEVDRLEAIVDTTTRAF